MTGGILQLVSYGIQDVFLINDPQITFFKSVYRRHTNFSKEEFDLKFTNELDFGKECECEIKKYGDLLHRLYLVIELPEITAKYNNLSMSDISNIIKPFKLNYNIIKNEHYKKHHYLEIKNVIKNKLKYYDTKKLYIDNYKKQYNTDILVKYKNEAVNELILYLSSLKQYKKNIICTSNEISLLISNIIIQNIINSNDNMFYIDDNINILYNIDIIDKNNYSKLDVIKIYNSVKNMENITDIIINSMMNNYKLLFRIYEEIKNNNIITFYGVCNKMNMTKTLFNDINKLNTTYINEYDKIYKCQNSGCLYNDYVMKLIKELYEGYNKILNNNKLLRILYDSNIINLLLKNSKSNIINLKIMPKIINDYILSIIKKHMGNNLSLDIIDTYRNIDENINDDMKCTININNILVNKYGQEMIYIISYTKNMISTSYIREEYKKIINNEELYNIIDNIGKYITDDLIIENTYNIIGYYWEQITTSIDEEHKKFYAKVLDVEYVYNNIGCSMGTIIEYIKRTSNYNILKDIINKINDDIGKYKKYGNIINNMRNTKYKTIKEGIESIKNKVIYEIYYKVSNEISKYCTIEDIIMEIDNKYEEIIIEVCKDIKSDKYGSSDDIYDEIIRKICNKYTKSRKISDKEEEIKDKKIKLKELRKELKGIVDRNVTNGNFAWIKKIGFYIIRYISISIGGQEIDRHTGEWLNIWYELTKENSKEEGYKKLIGDIKELTEYNNIPKRRYEMIIPIKFWFSKHLGNSLPLVSLLHSSIEISVGLREFSDVSYYEANTIITPKPKLKGYIMAEYIYVEVEERERLAKSKMEYLIETVEHSEDYTISSDMMESEIYSDEINNKLYNNLYIKKLYFGNISREIVWIYQDLENIRNKKYDNYEAINGGGIDGNIIEYVKIIFSGKDRQPYMDYKYYNYIVPYQNHTSIPSDGIYVYTFSISPETYQPNGTVNFSKIDDFMIVVKFVDDIYERIKDGRSKYRFMMYSLTHNILRIMSGQAGLAFYK